MDSGHETLNNSKSIIDNLKQKAGLTTEKVKFCLANWI